MAKAVFGEYSAYDTQGGVRFMKNSKLASEKNIPIEVVTYLKGKLLAVPSETLEPETPKFPMPTEEEKKRLLAESLVVAPELQRTPEEMAEATPLTADDFDTPVAEAQQTLSDYNAKQTDPRAIVLPTYPPELGIVDTTHVPEPLEPADNPPAVDSDFLEQVSIHTASIQDIAEALFNRFGLYTVYLNRMPVADELNPLTGEMFTKYHLGIAYQAAIRAQHTGVASQDATRNRALLEEGREASANFQVDPVPQTQADARRANSFDFRTSPQGTQVVAQTEIVHVMGADGQLHAEQREIPQGQIGTVNGAQSRFDAEEDEPILQPKMGGAPLIRPNW